jgi:hypothetical protein
MRRGCWAEYFPFLFGSRTLGLKRILKKNEKAEYNFHFG